MGLELVCTPALLSPLNVRSTILGIPINSIQQFLTTFVAGRVIICSGSSDPIIKAFASVETQTGLVYSPETRN